MRLFIALNFNDETRLRLVTLQEELRSYSESGNFSLSENLHLTLAFLGDCDVRQTSVAKAAMDSVKFEPFTITVEQIGNFRGDLWWAGIRLTPQLTKLQHELSQALKNNGFVLEKRRFSPHVTLGRKVITDVKPWYIEPFIEVVDKIDLMKSERINGKLTYTAIHSLRCN
jgi:2'-5' RNA ligase